jgi:carbonic anhydrase
MNNVNHPEGRFVTLINCIDGRAHPPVRAWLEANLDHVALVDRITAPGVDGVMAAGLSEKLDDIRSQVEISINAHQSNTIAVVGHHNCAGNPVPKEEHLRQIKDDVATIVAWQLPVRVIGLWVNEAWQVEKILDTAEDAQ